MCLFLNAGSAECIYMQEKVVCTHYSPFRLSHQNKHAGTCFCTPCGTFHRFKKKPYFCAQMCSCPAIIQPLTRGICLTVRSGKWDIWGISSGSKLLLIRCTNIAVTWRVVVGWIVTWPVEPYKQFLTRGIFVRKIIRELCIFWVVFKMAASHNVITTIVIWN